MIHHIIAHEGKNKFMSKSICGEILLSLTTLKCRHFAVKNNESDTPGLQQTNRSLQNLKGHDPCNCPLPMAFDTPKWKLSPDLTWPSNIKQFRKLNHVSQEEVYLKISYLLHNLQNYCATSRWDGSKPWKSHEWIPKMMLCQKISPLQHGYVGYL